MPRNWVGFEPNRIPVVWARLERHRFRVLIDTGAASSLVAPSIASGLGLRITGSNRIVGVTGMVGAVQLVEMTGVGSGPLELPPFSAGVLDLSDLRLGIQAILGVNAFSDRRLQIDFAEGRVYFLA